MSFVEKMFKMYIVVCCFFFFSSEGIVSAVKWNRSRV